LPCVINKIYGKKPIQHLITKPIVMAEIDNKNQHNNKGRRLLKKTTRVDLTPMVDLGFLLITFFVFTTTMSMPTAMHINIPYDKAVSPNNIRESCVLTVLLKKNNAIQYYEGFPTVNENIHETSFAASGIRKIIMAKKASVKKLTGDANNFVLIIKATDQSSFQNFVDMIDETTISCVKHYYISELDTQDKTLLAENQVRE